MRKYVIIFLCLLPGSLMAVQGNVALQIEAQSEYWLSQRLTAKLVVKTDAFSINDLTVKTQAEDNFIIIEPRSAAYKTTETIEETQWQHTVYEYQLYPLRAGQLELKPFQVQFSASMGYGQPKQTFNLTTEPVTLNVNQPTGLQSGQFALATAKMIVEVQYQPDIDRLKVGENFERAITITAQDVPDLLLPTLPVIELDSTFRVYPSEPVLSEQKVNGTLIASRVEKQNFVARNEGKITLPEMTFYWFDTRTEQIHKEVVASKSVTIVANPLVNISNKISNNKNLNIDKGFTTEQITDSSLWYLAALFCMGLIMLYYWFLQKKAVNQSDIAFKQFKKACIKGNDKQVYQSFYRWAVNTLTDTRPLVFKSIYQSYPDLKPHLICLESSLANQNDVCDFEAMLKEVAIIHKHLTVKQESKNNDLLLTLNPRKL